MSCERSADATAHGRHQHTLPATAPRWPRCLSTGAVEHRCCTNMSESAYASPCAVLSPAESATLDGSTPVRCQPAPPPPAPDPPTLSNTLLNTLLNPNKGNPCPFCSDRAPTNALSTPDWPARAHHPTCSSADPAYAAQNMRMLLLTPGRRARGSSSSRAPACDRPRHRKRRR